MDAGGGVMAGGNCMVTLKNNTIAYNTTKLTGGGIATNGTYGQASFSGENNIIYANISPDNLEIGAVEGGGATIITYSCINQLISGTGNIFIDPLFINPDIDNYGLNSSSPCIDAGNPDSPPDPDGTIADMGALYYNNTTTYIDDYPATENTTMSICYPNPFNIETTIRFNLISETEITIEVFNTSSQKVKILLNQKMQAGEHRIIWDGRDNVGKRLPNGIYFYKLKAGNNIETRKILIID